MSDFRTRRIQRIPGKAIRPIPNAVPPVEQEKRRGVRVNSQVPITVQWHSGGEMLRKEARTRVVGPYGCLVVLPENLDIKQELQLTNLVSKESNPAVVVWRGPERAEGWEVGIELVDPHMDFWGLDF